MAISKVSFFKTPQANDDCYYWTEDDLQLDTKVYNTATGYLTLDVMANDLGGNAKTLYSIDDGNGNPVNPTDLFNADTLTNGVSAWQTTADGNQARINNGKIEFDLSHELPGGVNSLGAGDQFTDTFIYAIRLGNGTLSWAHVRITIDGANDSASIIVSGKEDTSVAEDGGVANGTLGDPNASGTLTVNDVDVGENKFKTPASLDGTYGTFSFNENTGAWSYLLDQGKADNLTDGQLVTDTLTVSSLDGTASHDIVIKITGSNDDATIGVVGLQDTGVSEDGGAANATKGDPSASGTLVVNDVDTGENKFQAPGSLDGTYGTFTFTENTGAWTYLLDQSKADELTGTTIVTETLTVMSLDGTANYDIKVDVSGTNDNASISVVGVPDQSAVEAGGTGNNTLGDPSASGLLAVSDVDLGENKFQAPGSLDGTYGTFTLNTLSGAWTYTLDQGKADKLTAGEAAQDSLTVTSFDGTATYDIKVDITGSNDKASISHLGVPDTGVVEAGGLANAALGDPSASGTVAVSDVDSGEDKFQAPGALDGAYGTFTFDENSGAWTYTLNQGKADHLTDDELTSDTLNVTSFDGTASFAITVDITGSNDDASIGVVGTPDLTVVEAGGTANGTLGDPSASGQLAVSDLDLGENKFAAPGSLAGTYGIFTFNENSGVWTYTLDQDKADKLTGGEAATDKLTVTSFDNTASYDITVNIAGSNDDASISVVGSPDTNVAEAGGVGNGILGDPGASGQLAVSDVDFGENKFQTLGSLDGTYGKFTFDADSGAWNYLLDQSKADTLTDGELATDKLTVTSLDGTDTYDITVNIAGSNDDASISVVGSPDANVTEAGGVGNATPGDPSASGTLAVSDVDLGENKFQTPVSLDGIYGSFTFDADSGAWTYTLNQGKADSLIAGEAATDKLTVTSYDGTASFDIKVDITGSNDNASISVDDAGDSTVVEAGGTGNTTPGDPDALGSLAVGDVDAGQNKFKTPASLDGTYGTFTFDADSGDWTYTLDESKADSLAGGAAATDKLTVSSLDGTATYDITVDITGANDAPVARDDSYQTDEDVALIANGGGGNPAGLLGHLDGAETADDADVDGDDIDIAAVKVGATVVTDGGAGDEDAAADGTIIFKTANGLVTLDVETGAFSYMSNKDYNGSDGFEYKVADGTLTSDWAKVDLTINAVNDAPVIISNGGGDEASPSVPENTTIVTKVVATDVDGPTLKYTIGGGADAALFKIDEATGDLGFLAAPNFEAPGDGDADNVYDVVVKVSDGSLSDTQALHVAVTDVNEQPDAGADLAVTAAETVNDTTVLADVNATDPDFGGGNDLANSFENLAYSIVAGNGAGLFEIDPATGQISLIAGKTLDYEATQQYVLTVRATDGGNLFDDVEVTIDVTDVAENHAPLATDDVWIISQSTTARLPSLAVLANDTDSDGHRLRVASVSGSGVTLNADGTIALVTGTTNGSFTYTVVDDHGGSDIGTVNFTVVNATSGFDLTGFAYDASYLDAAGGTDTLTGAGGIDVLYGGTGNNIDNLVGSTGNDILRGGQANDVIDGGDGIDLIDLSDGTAGITFTLTQSSSDASTGALGANLGTDTYKKIEGVIGTNSADKLTGSNSDDVIYGGGGNDTINGGDSNDVIYGGVGADAMNGGTGRDTYLYNGLSEGGATETISGFTTGATGDVLDLHDLLVDFAPGYDGTNAFTGGFVSFDTSLGNTEVKIDADGSAGGGGAVTLVTLTSVILTSVDTDNYTV